VSPRRRVPSARPPTAHAARAVLVVVAVVAGPACGGAGATAFPDLGRLSDDWGCGVGFARSDARQTMAVVISHPGPLGPELLATPTATVTLPDPDWQAEVRVGRDLFANWCDDLVEPGEPTARIDRRWPLRSGTLEITLPTLADAGRAEGRLDGAVVEVDGDERTLPSMRLTNAAWGRFAG